VGQRLHYTIPQILEIPDAVWDGAAHSVEEFHRGERDAHSILAAPLSPEAVHGKDLQAVCATDAVGDATLEAIHCKTGRDETKQIREQGRVKR
jgi:hypothetical protein